MFTRYLGALIISSCLTSPSFSQDYNGKILHYAAEGFDHKIWSRSLITPEQIESELDFLYNEAPLKDKVRNFDDLYAEKTTLIPDPRFGVFADACRELRKTADSKKDLAIRMLFEAVSKKTLHNYTRLQKLKNAKEEEEKSPRKKRTPEEEKLLEFLLNADKSIPLGCTTRPIWTGSR